MIQGFDLHMHTTNSDGELSVREIVDELRKKGITTFSITDHDNIKSIFDMRDVDLKGMTYIKGVEFSSKYKYEYDMHILGYDIDENNQNLIETCQWMKGQRRLRIVDLAQQVTDQFGIKFNMDDIEYIVEHENNPGRPHLAKLLIQYGIVNNTEEAFRKYLGDLHSRIQYKLNAQKAFDLIHEAGGIAIWAHPKKVENDYGIDMEDILDEMAEKGLDGIEIGNCLHSLEDLRRYQNAANKRNLLVTAGSDYHGIHTKPDVHLGVIYNSQEDEVISLDEITLLK